MSLSWEIYPGSITMEEKKLDYLHANLFSNMCVISKCVSSKDALMDSTLYHLEVVPLYAAPLILLKKCNNSWEILHGLLCNCFVIKKPSPKLSFTKNKIKYKSIIYSERCASGKQTENKGNCSFCRDCQNIFMYYYTLKCPLGGTKSHLFLNAPVDFNNKWCSLCANLPILHSRSISSPTHFNYHAQWP